MDNIKFAVSSYSFSKLIKKGVKESVINAVLEDLGEQDETAEKLAEKYMKNKENTLKNSVKCFKYLVSKGFDFDVSKQIAERYKED